MDKKRFHKSASGKCIQAGSGEAAYLASVPHPLPPAIQPDLALMNVLSDADRALGELSGLGRTMPNPHLLIGPFIRREAVLSSRIEGTQTDIANLYAHEAGQLYLPGFEPVPPESDVREVMNYVRAMEYGLERLKTLPVSLRFIRELHESLMEGVRGEHATPGRFRRSQNWIGRPGCTLNEADFVPPPPAQLKECLDLFEKYLHRNNQHPPLMRLAFIHYQFEAIHPFIDGNGRIGRLLISLLLVHWNLLPLPLLYLSAFFEKRRRDYYDGLTAVSEHGAWREWIAFFLRGVSEQAHDAIRRAKQLQNLQMEWHQKVTQARSSALLFPLINTLFERPILTIPDAQRFLNVTYRSAKLCIDKLIEMDILVPIIGISHGKTFYAKRILNIIQQKG
ncbi:MAG: Fic family protein [Calditrichaceae bacterium]|nr:Fic family protein [Calditrichia bacterium]NUQ42692.1 Fic family protein [Calditrichaceae bacterium]